MRELKSDIIHAIYQCAGVDNEKLVEVSDICDKFQSRLDTAEALKPSHNTGSPKLPCPHLDNVGGCCKKVGHVKCTCDYVNRQLRAGA